MLHNDKPPEAAAPAEKKLGSTSLVEAKLNTYEGVKTKRRRKILYSTITTSQGEVFTLLPGKSRNGLETTLLGTGVFGRVKKALNPKGKIVAAKIINRQSYYIKNIKNEVAMLEKLKREPVLVIISDTDRDKAIIFQTLIEGKPLMVFPAFGTEGGDTGYLIDLFSQHKTATLAERRLLQLKFMQILMKAFVEINAFHEQQIIHLDTHFGNFIYNETEDKVTLVDFGRSRNFTGNDVKGLDVTLEGAGLYDYGRLLTDVTKYLPHLYKSEAEKEADSFFQGITDVINKIRQSGYAADKAQSILANFILVIRSFDELKAGGELRVTDSDVRPLPTSPSTELVTGMRLR